MTHTADEVKRYRVSYKNGVIEEDGGPRTCGDSEPMIRAQDHDRIVSSLKDQLQASQCAEQMLGDDVKALRADLERLGKAITTALDEECNDPFRVLRSAMEKPE